MTSFLRGPKSSLRVQGRTGLGFTCVYATPVGGEDLACKRVQVA